MTDLDSWLVPRLEAAPRALRMRVVDELNRAPAEECLDLPARLRAAGDRLIARAREAGDSADPVDVLAADALITYACEAIAELSPELLRKLR